MASQDNETAVADENVDLPKLNLDVQVERSGDCTRHVVVTVPVTDVKRYFDKQYDELMPRAEVPGFRPGKAPRKLIEAKFRKTVGDQVKGSLLMDSLTQISEDDIFSAIGEPDFDFEAVEIDSEKPLQFEFNIEVRPEFDLPSWKGLKLEQPDYEFTTEDIDQEASNILRERATFAPVEGALEVGDSIEISISVPNGEEIAGTIESVNVDVRPTLSFQDGKIDGFDGLVVGKSIGDEVNAKIELAETCTNEDLRGKTVDCTVKVLDGKRPEGVQLTDDNFKDFGEHFGDAGDVRDAIKQALESRLEYDQNQKVRKQISDLLTESADWELPPELLDRQSQREMDRAILELRSTGFGENYIAAFENDLRQNSKERTRVALKEHFILERIAEDQKIEDAPEDYDVEIARIAASTGESIRRLRARLERSGQMDTLRNQIIERKVVNLIKENAEFTGTDYERNQGTDVFGVQQSVIGSATNEIPEAKSDFVDPQNAGGSGDHVAPRAGR